MYGSAPILKNTICEAVLLLLPSKYDTSLMVNLNMSMSESNTWFI